MAIDVSHTILQLFSLLLLAGVVGAPLPLVWHILTTQHRRSSDTLAASHMGLAALALWVIVHALIVTSLGLIGHLWLLELLLAEAALLVFGVWLLMRDRAKPASRLGRDCGRRLGDLGEWPAAERWLLALVCGMGALLLVQEIWIPTQDYDSLSFQLPRVAEWIQRGALFEPIPQFSPTNPINRYPYAWNTLYLLAFAPMGHDQFILVPNLVAWVMVGLAAYRLVRLSGGHRAGSSLTAALLLLMPLSVGNVHSAHHDLPLAALLLTSFYFSLHAWRQGDGCSAFLAGACAGMLLGTKMSGVGYFALLATVWLWLFLQSWLEQRSPWSAIVGALREHRLMAVLALASIGVLGSSWYLRNAWETGNPLGFFQVSMFGRVVWKGSITKALVNQTNLVQNFNVNDSAHWSILWHASRESSGLPGLAFVAAALCAPYRLARRTADRAVLRAMVVLCLGSFYIYAAGPWSAKLRPADDLSSVWIGRQMRYAFPFWSLLAVIAGTQIRFRLTPWVKWVLAGVTAVATVDALRHSGMFLEWYPRRSTALLAGAVALCFAASTPALHRFAGPRLVRLATWGRQRPGASIGPGIVIALAAMLLAAHTTLSALGVRQSVRNSLYGGIARFIDEDLPAHARVGFWGTHKTYLLYGRTLRRPLHPLALHAFPTWKDMLVHVRAARVDVVAVGPLIDQSPLWSLIDRMADDGSGFQRIHGDDARHHVLVYRVLPGTD